MARGQLLEPVRLSFRSPTSGDRVCPRASGYVLLCLRPSRTRRRILVLEGISTHLVHIPQIRCKERKTYRLSRKAPRKSTILL